MSLRLAFECSTSVMGGFERFLMTLVPVLHQQDIEPVLIANEEGPLLPKLCSLGVPVEVLPARTREQRAALTQRLRERGVHIAQSHSFDPGFAMAARRAGCANVWRLKGHVCLSHPDDADQQTQLLALGCALADAVVAPSHFLANQLAGHWPDVQVIPNGIDLDLVDRELARLGPACARQVASLGHLVPSKHHEVFLQAAARLQHRFPERQFAIFGQPSGNPEYASELSRLLQQLDLPADVLRGPFQSGFVEALHTVCVAVFPFINEGFANAAVEAMAVGRAVIAADSGVFPEHIEHGVDGLLVRPQDPEALADAIADLLDHPCKAEALGRAARRKARRLWDQNQCARRYADFYRSLNCG